MSTLNTWSTKMKLIEITIAKGNTEQRAGAIRVARTMGVQNLEDEMMTEQQRADAEALEELRATFGGGS